MGGDSQLWSFLLTSIGAAGYFLTMRKNIAGPIIGAAVQILWVAYALAAPQYFFLFSAALYGGFNIYGIRRWRREKQTDRSAAKSAESHQKE